MIQPVIPVFAQSTPELPQTNNILKLTRPFAPVQLQGLIFDPQQPLNFDFVVTDGDVPYVEEPFKAESEKLIKYFMAAMTIPEEDMWVNLSVYEHDRIIPKAFGQTAMGRDLLAQDYLLKQLTSSLIHPETDTGEAFWDEVHQLGQGESIDEAVHGSFHKIWIIPDKVTVAKQANRAFIYQSHLKVMLKSDLIAMQKARGETLLESEEGAEPNEEQNEIIRRMIVPLIEKEVNTGKHFAPLRQIYNAVILAAYYRRYLYETIVGRAYIDNKKTNGIRIDDLESKEKIYARYLESYQKGVFNLVKEDYDPQTQSIIPRKYFSGGAILGEMDTSDYAMATNDPLRDALLPREKMRNIRRKSKLSQRISVIDNQKVNRQITGKLLKGGAHVVKSVFQLIYTGTAQGLQAIQRQRETAKQAKERRNQRVIGALGEPRGKSGFLTRALKETSFSLPAISMEKVKSYVRPVLYGYILGGLIFISYFGITQMSQTHMDLQISSATLNESVQVIESTETRQKIHLPKENIVVTTQTSEQAAPVLRDTKKNIPVKIARFQKPVTLDSVDTYQPPDQFQTIKNVYRVLQVTDPYKTKAEIDAIVNIMVKIIFAESGSLKFNEQIKGGPAKGYAQILPWVALYLMRDYQATIFDYIEMLGVDFSDHQITRLKQIFEYYDANVQKRSYEKRKAYLQTKAESLQIDEMFKDNDILMVLLERLYLADRLKDVYVGTELKDIEIGKLWKEHYNTRLGKGYSAKVVKHANDADRYLEEARNFQEVELERMKAEQSGFKKLNFKSHSDYLPSITRHVMQYVELEKQAKGDLKGEIKSRMIESLANIEKQIKEKGWRKRDWNAKTLKPGDVLNRPRTNESLVILKTGDRIRYISSKTAKVKEASLSGLKRLGYKRINSQLPLLRVSERPLQEKMTLSKNQTNTIQSKDQNDQAMVSNNVGGILLDAKYIKMNVLDKGQPIDLDLQEEAYYVDINNISGFMPRILDIIPYTSSLEFSK